MKVVVTLRVTNRVLYTRTDARIAVRATAHHAERDGYFALRHSVSRPAHRHGHSNGDWLRMTDVEFKSRVVAASTSRVPQKCSMLSSSRV